MKKFSLWTTAALLAFGMLVAVPASAQDEAAAPHQIGLIDLAHIFKNYDKFKDQTTGLEAAAKDAEAKAQAMLQQMKDVQAQMQGLAPGSPDYNAKESTLIELQTKLQAFRQVEQRDIVRKQAEVYKKIYMEVQEAVGQYAKYYKYTLIIRFNRAQVAEAGDPQGIIQSMNRQVVYFQSQDDLTDPILNFLNDKYHKASASNN